MPTEQLRRDAKGASWTKPLNGVAEWPYSRCAIRFAASDGYPGAANPGTILLVT
jgi:hypothetical protein